MDLLVWNSNSFQILALRCDGQQHDHLKWTPSMANQSVVFPTAQEASYPKLLCTRVAQCVVDACKLRGATFTIESFQPQQRLDETKLPGKRGVKTLSPLVSEYASITDVKPQTQAYCRSMQDWPNTRIYGRHASKVNLHV